MAKNKTAVITGSTTGIGFGIAKTFAKNNYDIVLNGFTDDPESLTDFFEKEYGINAHFIAADLTEESGCKKLIDETLSRFKSIDVLINNAGIQHVSPLEDFATEMWNQILALNLTAAFLTTKFSFPHMKEKKRGTIINMSSVHGLVASEYKSAYVTTKHGLIGLTKVTALEGAPFNITCNAVCPGYVKTPLVEGQIKDQARAHNISEDEVIKKVMLAKHVIKDFVTVEAIADACLLLASTSGRLITGTTLTLDGGWSAQ